MVIKQLLPAVVNRVYTEDCISRHVAIDDVKALTISWPQPQLLAAWHFSLPETPDAIQIALNYNPRRKDLGYTGMR